MTDRERVIELLDHLGVTYDLQESCILIDPVHTKVIGEHDMKFVFNLKGNFVEIDLSA